MQVGTASFGGRRVAERYSERRLREDFNVHILLSEPLVAGLDEILAAARADFPELTWNDLGGSRAVLDTTTSCDLAWQGDARLNEPDETRFITRAGRASLHWGHAFQLARATFPNAEDAVARHQSWLEIRVPSRGTSLAARFDAACRVTCLGAIFAAFPTCLAVYFQSGNTIVSPERWTAAAREALKPRLPFFEWFGFYANPLVHEGKTFGFSLGTIGMAAFNGRELVAPKAPRPAAELAGMVLEMLNATLQRGHQFQDSDTCSLEGDETIYRIRHCAEGRLEMQTDAWVLLHPDAFVNEIEALGPRTRNPPPAGMKLQIWGYDTWLAEQVDAFRRGVPPPP